MVYIESFVFGDFQDVVRKIFAFLETVRQEDVCILSASGTVSSLTLCQPDVSNGFSRHEVPLLKKLISYMY